MNFFFPILAALRVCFKLKNVAGGVFEHSTEKLYKLNESMTWQKGVLSHV